MLAVYSQRIARKIYRHGLTVKSWYDTTFFISLAELFPERLSESDRS